MTNATNKVARVAAGLAGLGLVAMSFAPLVSAQTATTTTTTTTTSASVTFTRNLTIGSRGADVTALQTWLIAKGFSIPAGATGYFGGQTKAAVAAYQAAHSITPAAGFFGPITRAAVMADTGTTTGGTTTTSTGGSLSGGEGSLNNFKIVGASNTTLNAGASNTVYGVEFMANGSDLQVNRVDFDAYLSGGTGSTRPWTVFGQAQLMRGNTVVATLDASDMNNWSQDGTAGNGNTIYRLRFTPNDVVKMGTTADYFLKLSTQGNINSGNNNNAYTFFLPGQGVRATDAKGLSQYSSSTNQSNSTVTVLSATAGSLTLSTGSDNPQSTTVQASGSSSTNDVTLTTFSLQARDGDVTVYTIPVSIATTTASSSDSIRTIKLYQGGTLLDTESYAVGSGALSVKFKNLNDRIAQGTTQNFRVAADINPVGGTNTVQEGATVAVSIPNSGFEAVNSAGNNVSVTGSVTGNVITFRTIGLALDNAPVSTSATASAVGTSGTQQGNFTFTFNVTAFGQDVFFVKSGAGVVGRILTSGSATSTASSTALTSTADTSGGNSANYVVHSGQTKQVTVTVTVPAGSNASLSAILDSFKWGTTDATATASSSSFSNNYQTAPVYLHA